MKNYQIKDISQNEAEFIERYYIEVDTDSDYLTFFDGDPDYVKTRGDVSAYFIVDDNLAAIWVYYLDNNAAVNNLLCKFQKGMLKEVNPNSWDAFKYVSNGIAFRNYQGYSYTLYQL